MSLNYRHIAFCNSETIKLIAFVYFRISEKYFGVIFELFFYHSATAFLEKQTHESPPSPSLPAIAPGHGNASKILVIFLTTGRRRTITEHLGSLCALFSPDCLCDLTKRDDVCANVDYRVVSPLLVRLCFNFVVKTNKPTSSKR